MGLRWCEAMEELPNGRYTRCGRRPTEDHHKLTRARGGLILDDAGETYHHIQLCPWHHKIAHDYGSAFENGLLIDGYVTTRNGKPFYVGSDEYLTRRYGDEQIPDHVRGDV